MSIVITLAVIVAFGFCLWLIEKFVPMAEPLKILLRVVVIMIIVWLVLSIVGIVPPPPFIKGLLH